MARCRKRRRVGESRGVGMGKEHVYVTNELKGERGKVCYDLK